MSSSEKQGVRFSDVDEVNDIEVEYEDEKLSEQNDDYGQFLNLSDGVVGSLALLQADLQHLMIFKDELMTEMLPPNVLLNLSLVSGKVFRSFSDLQFPLWELLRLVKVYSSPWEEKAAALKKLHDDYERKRNQLNVALRRLTTQDAENKRVAKAKRVMNWEKLFCKIQLAKGHGRRWKFRMYDFKKKAEAGIENLGTYFQEGLAADPVVVDSESKSVVSVPVDEVAAVEENAKVEMETVEFVEEVVVPNTIEDLEDLGDLELDDVEILDEKPTNDSAEIASVQLQSDVIPVETSDAGVWTHETEFTKTLHIHVYAPKSVKAKEVICHVKFADTETDLEPVEIAQPETGRKMKRVTIAQPEVSESSYQQLSCVVPEQVFGQPEPELVITCENERADKFGQVKLTLEQLNDLNSVEVEDEGTVDISELEPKDFPILSSDKVCGNLPLVFYWTRKAVFKAADRENNTIPIYDLVEELTGIDLSNITKEELTRAKVDECLSPRPITPQPESVSKEVFEQLNEEFDVKLRNLEQEYLTRLRQLEDDLAQRPPEAPVKDTSERAVSAQRSLPGSRLSSRKSDRPVAKGSFHEGSDVPPSQSNGGSNHPGHQQAKVVAPSKPARVKPGKNFLIGRPLPDWGSHLPDDFFERLDLFSHLSAEHRATLVSRVRAQVARTIEQQLEELYRTSGVDGEIEDALDDVCIPALFMPQRTDAPVYNPRAHQYFGAQGVRSRFTQPPSMLSLPPIPNRISVLNLFDIGARNSVPSFANTGIDIHTQLNMLKKVPKQQ